MNKAFFAMRGGAVRACVVGAFLLMLGAQMSWSWGREGHRLTALVAWQYLTPEAKAQVAALLGNETLADIAPWADEYRRDHPETGPWHYVDIPRSADQFDRQRDCPASKTEPASPWRDCITDRILYFEGRLGDTSLSTADRVFALKFLVHLIGDVHQPFHTLGDERGGNGVAVTFLASTMCGNYKCNLHGVWDGSILAQQGLSEAAYTAELLKEIEENHWVRLAGGQPTAWADISHRYAVLAWVPNGALLTQPYVLEESKVVDAQLALGGLRLARVLNRIFAAPEPPPAATPQPVSPPEQPVAPVPASADPR